jgi:outer membrane biosynthesis protein TonB
LGSRNGIKINKKRSAGKTLQDRDEVEVGGVRLLFLDPNEVREAPVVLPEGGAEEEGTNTTMNPEEEPEASQPSRRQRDVATKQVDEEPPAPEPEPEPEPQSEEAPAPSDSGEQPQAEGEGEQPSDEAPPEGSEEGGATNPDAEGGEMSTSQDELPARGGLDFSNRSTLIGLAIGASALLIGIVVIILLVAGA